MRLPCGSTSTSRTRRSASASEAARLMAVVVLPTPPFWLATATIFAHCQIVTVTSRKGPARAGGRRIPEAGSGLKAHGGETAYGVRPTASARDDRQTDDGRFGGLTARTAHGSRGSRLTAHGSRLTAHGLTAHGSRLTAQAVGRPEGRPPPALLVRCPRLRLAASARQALARPPPPCGFGAAGLLPLARCEVTSLSVSGWAGAPGAGTGGEGGSDIDHDEP